MHTSASFVTASACAHCFSINCASICMGYSVLTILVDYHNFSGGTLFGKIGLSVI